MDYQSVVKEFEKRSKPLTKSELEAEKRYSPTRLDVRKISKSDYAFLLKSFVKDVPESEQAKIWLNVFNKSPYRNLDSIAIDWFKLRQKRKLFPLMDYSEDLFKWIDKIDCWQTGDMLASLTSQIHEANPKKYYSKVKTLSEAKSYWQNRMALLSLYYYSSSRKQFPSFQDSIQIVEKQLKKDNYHLQKAIGWTLREMNNVYPKQTQKWIDKYLNELSSPAFSTAIEKIKGAKKEEWKLKRKQYRAQK